MKKRDTLAFLKETQKYIHKICKNANYETEIITADGNNNTQSLSTLLKKKESVFIATNKNLSFKKLPKLPLFIARSPVFQLYNFLGPL